MTTKTAKKTRIKREFHAAEKIRAVLSVWTERRRPAQICRELSINATLLSIWEKRAMEGMMKALEPRQGKDMPVSLNPKLEKLVDRQTGKRTASKLIQRLSTIQTSPEPKKEKKTA